ncbi:hypothetical protein Tco_1456001 [Tanacetum coccineum]
MPSLLLTPPQDEPIIVSDESEEEEEVDKDKDTHATSHDSHTDELEQQKAKAKAKVASLKARPSYLDINQLTDLLVTSLKPEFSKLLVSHDFSSCLPNTLKELPSKFTELSREIKELKKHVQDMEIELPGDLKEILTKLETFTSTISSLSSQTLDSLPSLFNKVTDTLNRFATVMENASEVARNNVPSTGLATASPTEGEKNTNPATRDVEQTNLHNELFDLLGIDILTQYYNKKLLYDKYCDKMLKRRKCSKIINCVTRMEYLDQTEKELKFDFNKPFKEQDPLSEQNDLAKKKRKRTGDSTDHSRSLEDWEVSSLQFMQWYKNLKRSLERASV